MNEFKSSLDGIKASEELKQSTLRFVEEQRQSYVSRKARPIRFIALAAACLFIILTMSGYAVYKKPISYISIDVNPSVELDINCFGRVVSAKAYNADAEGILNDLSLSNLPYMQAIDLLLESEAAKGYLNYDSLLVFTVISDNSEELIKQLGENEAWEAYEPVTNVSERSCREEAHCYEMSFGKYEAYLELSQHDESVTVEDCHEMSMREIHNRIESCQEHGDATADNEHSSHKKGSHHAKNH